MIKLSEFLKYYEDMHSYDEFETFYSEKDISRKISILKMLLKGLGDVEFDIDILKRFIFEISKMKFGQLGISEAEADIQIKMYYELIKDYQLTDEMISTLFTYHDIYSIKFLFDDIKISFASGIITDKEKLKQIFDITIYRAKELIKKETLKLEKLKTEYSPEFISQIQKIMKEKMITYDRVISILPSKELIESSTVRVPLGYSISSGEDLVTRRLDDLITDKELEKTEDDDYIELGLCSTGQHVYTSFTKKEYEDSLIQKEKQLTRKK